MRTVHRIVLLGIALLPAPVLVAELPAVPKELQPPAGQPLLIQLHGEGKQIYVCQRAGSLYAWKLKAPDAKLTDQNGNLAGRHFAGPTWESNDRSQVSGKLTASVASPEIGSIPWLLLTATAHSGTGAMQKVQSIQRLNTKGGAAPAAGCTAGNESAETAVRYEASYFFYGNGE